MKGVLQDPDINVDLRAFEVGNDIISYVRTDIHEGNAELIEVSSKLYYADVNEYFDKVGKWLDSQE